MAIDNTPPRLKLIVTIAVITVVTLVGIDFVLKSYYGMMVAEATHSKLAPTTERDNLHSAEKVALTSAAIPIDQAMAQLAKGARPEAITPHPSDDLAPMTGWAKLPKPAPVPQPHAAADPATTSDAGGALLGADGVLLSTDGGVLLSTDGGARHTLAGDAGVHVLAPAPVVAPAPHAPPLGPTPHAPPVGPAPHAPPVGPAPHGDAGHH